MTISVKCSSLIERLLIGSYTVGKTNKLVKGGNHLKIKLSVSKEHYQEIKTALETHGIEINENSDLVLSENNRYLDNLIVKDTETNEYVRLSINEIISIETFGHSVEVHTQDKIFQSSERLYQIASQLDPAEFLRISNSVIIARDKIKRINPTLSMKFMLTLINDRKVDVTRSYYHIFKDYFGI